MTAANDLAVRRALEMAGVEFIDENGGGPGGATEQTPAGGHGHPFRPAFPNWPFQQIRGHQYSNNCHLTLTKCQNVYTLMYIH